MTLTKTEELTLKLHQLATNLQLLADYGNVTIEMWDSRIHDSGRKIEVSWIGNTLPAEYVLKIFSGDFIDDVLELTIELLPKTGLLDYQE